MSQLGDAPGNAAEAASADPAWSCEEIERLYRQALDAVEAVVSDLNSVTQTLSADPDGESDLDEAAISEAEPDAVFATSDAGHSAAVAESQNAEEERPEPAQVIESLLFVGGQPLTAKAICGLLRGDFDANFVEQAVDELNRRYARQNRPYEVRLAEGGYRIILRPEFEPLRNRVYGFGPRQVRLSQDALEILALVAYRQPLTKRKTEEIAKRNAGAALRQLLERGLLVLERPEGARADEAQYRTTPRFLQLFGVARLDDLPQIEDLNYK
jgi:segregation and condensation protein B